MKKILLSSITLLICFVSYAQDSLKHPDFISLEGGVARHSLPENPELLNDYAPSLELTYGFATNHRKDYWMRYLHVQYVGVSLLYMDLYDFDGLYSKGPKGALGYYLGVLPSLYIRVFNTKYVSGYFVPSFGVCYQSKTWRDTPTDYTRFIGSKINTCTKADYLMEIHAGKRLSINTGIRFLHYSNSAFYLPNTGINVFAVKAGLKYNLIHEKN